MSRLFEKSRHNANISKTSYAPKLFFNIRLVLCNI